MDPDFIVDISDLNISNDFTKIKIKITKEIKYPSRIILHPCYWLPKTHNNINKIVNMHKMLDVNCSQSYVEPKIVLYGNKNMKP